jgi:predicted DNA binding CopG/RHH family protein
MEKDIIDELNNALGNPKSVKIRISPFLSSDVVRALKLRAKSEGRPYNIVLEDLLREVLFDNTLKSRLERLEAEVFKTGTDG